jgi:hypothetical protein
MSCARRLLTSFSTGRDMGEPNFPSDAWLEEVREMAVEALDLAEVLRERVIALEEEVQRIKGDRARYEWPT